jgi:hypothetical protein
MTCISGTLNMRRERLPAITLIRSSTAIKESATDYAQIPSAFTRELFRGEKRAG